MKEGEGWIRLAAAWLDEEYRLGAMLRPKGDDALQHAGHQAALSETAALLRQWAETGREPPHRPVRQDDRDAYEKLTIADAHLWRHGQT